MFQDKFCVPANHFPGGSPGNDDKSGGGGGEQQITHLFFFFVPRLGKTTSVLIFFFFSSKKNNVWYSGASTAALLQADRRQRRKMYLQDAFIHPQVIKVSRKPEREITEKKAMNLKQRRKRQFYTEIKQSNLFGLRYLPKKHIEFVII